MTMRTVFVIFAVLLCIGTAAAQVQPGYYTTPDNGAPHIVKPRNGAIYIEAGGETAVYRNSGGKYVLKGFFYNGNEANMRAPLSKNPPYIVTQSSTSYTYHAAGSVKNYRLDAAMTQQAGALFDTDRLEEHDGDVRSEFVDTSLERVEEIAPNYEKYMKRAQEDRDNAPVWLQVAQATLLVSTYTKTGQTELLGDLLLVKAQTIRRMAPHMIANPCPDVIPAEIWEKAKNQ